MKKNLLFVLPLLSVLTLASCSETSSVTSNGGSNQLGGSSTTEVNDDYIIQEPVTIDFWTNIGQANRPTINNIIEDFKEVEPNITVNHIIKDGDYNALKDVTIQGFPANNYPDIIYCYPDHVAEYLNYGYAVNLDPYINNSEYGWTEEDLADIPAAYLDEGRNYSASGTYSLPLSKSTEAMYYNRRVIGLNLSKYNTAIGNNGIVTQEYIENLTWEELFDVLCPAIMEYLNDEEIPSASKIFSLDPENPAIVGYDSDDNLFITLAKQYDIPYTSIDPNTGRGSIDFNNDEMKALMKKWNSYALNDYLITKGGLGGSEYVNTLFNTNNILFSIGSTGGVGYQYASTNPEIMVAPVPYAKGHDRYVISQGPSVAILSHQDSNRELASWLFYKFLSNTDNATAWSINTGYMGLRKSVYETDLYQEYVSEADSSAWTKEKLMAQSAIFCGTDVVTDSLFVSPAFVGSSGARTEVGGLMTQIILADHLLTDDEMNKLFSEAENQALLGLPQ